MNTKVFVLDTVAPAPTDPKFTSPLLMTVVDAELEIVALSADTADPLFVTVAWATYSVVELEAGASKSVL